MSKLKSLFIICLILSLQAFAGDLSNTQRVKQCQETCVDFEEPGFALKKCLSQCLKLIDSDKNEKSYCNSYEEDCDRDGDSDDGPWFNG